MSSNEEDEWGKKCHRCEGTLDLQRFTYEESYKYNRLILCKDCVEYIVTKVWGLFH